ncbi:MAG: 50S ribosomal protein L29 [Desulfovibrio sp.]
MKIKELRELDNAQLAEKLTELRKELFSLRFQHSTAQLENTQTISDVKKAIARALTVERERELGA